MESKRNRCIPQWKNLCADLGIHTSSEKATKILDAMEYQRKLQDRDTRHECADQCLESSTLDDAHKNCMNAHA